MTLNEELKMTTNQPRSFGQRLWWIIRTTLLIFVLAVWPRPFGRPGVCGLSGRVGNSAL